MVPLDEERDLETLRQISHLLTRENQRLLTANLELRAELARLRGEPEIAQLAFTVEPTVSTRPTVPATPQSPRPRVPRPGMARGSNPRCRSSSRCIRSPPISARVRPVAARWWR